ncbi:MAG: hypothetical protein KAU20_06030 [Nanoarchaeota archaeon]|nr:hypothetical protein [Nanoarchaeota archaeon]
MKERNFQTEFSKRNIEEGVFELKLAKTKSIRFDAVKPHQVTALKQAESENGLFHKISDFPIFANNKMRFNLQKPFDCFLVKNTNAYVVIMFYEPRKKKSVYYVLIEDWLKAEKKSEKKSITEKELKSYSCLEVNYLDKKQT